MSRPEAGLVPPPSLKKGETAVVRVESLSLEALGVGHVNGKAIFIEGALPGEIVRAQVTKRRKSYDLGKSIEIIEASPDRVVPRCSYFGVCGGCSMQHLDSAAQLPVKEKVLRDNLQRIGKVQPESWLPALSGPHWGYRRKARLGVRVVEKKGGVIVGFRERAHSFITPLASCEVLDARIGAMLPALRELIATLSCPDRIPQIEAAVGDGRAALAFRHLVPMTEQDDRQLAEFGAQHDVQIFRQPGRPDALVPIWPRQPEMLAYELPEYDVRLEFAPADFIQVNAGLNRLMISQALRLLEPQPDDAILDLFCGLGNFSLPLARRARRVLGLEADAAMIGKARHNATLNGLNNVEFRSADLHSTEGPEPWGADQYDKWLLDPPRTGAIEVIKRLPEQGAPRRIVYVSCNPGTLARDAEVLVHMKGYRLQAAGVMDMFPQTSHVEAMALFVRNR